MQQVPTASGPYNSPEDGPAGNLPSSSATPSAPAPLEPGAAQPDPTKCNEHKWVLEPVSAPLNGPYRSQSWSVTDSIGNTIYEGSEISSMSPYEYFFMDVPDATFDCYSLLD